jgi:hypothetical protein
MKRLDKWPTERSSRYKYDYDKLFDGSIWECREGTDFTCQPMSFYQNLYARARKLGIGLHGKVYDKKVVIQAYGNEAKDDTNTTSDSASAGWLRRK